MEDHSLADLRQQVGDLRRGQDEALLLLYSMERTVNHLAANTEVTASAFCAFRRDYLLDHPRKQ